ncbi:hypothetical protein DL764_000597 [Monosporascus ibericus]|uniref:C2H2-type domain-containing protein n=1 Tax=Monosporascus ibericus TaxID=155417 RepID=A0A4Q4TVE8_9PEZI|nr:hypothetical protein DL764_000597 [Monosporascus ibericus]
MAPSPTTPTPSNTTFGQRPLPTSPFPQAVQIPEKIDERRTPKRENSQHSRKSRGDSEDVDMDESDGEGQGDDGAGSDDESVNADGSRSNKKKKSQRFYCTDYPPCNLSFTRSEHLARHIRKHTGERPFQCHCARRFSRLDNLRQHAQTVHVNEDIPIDSLAATGTRFQRQIRTDRVRQPGRARASTAGSMGAPGRGHAKSLSTSSISSVSSTFSARDDVRRRPAPLVMADPRSRLSVESYHSPSEGAYAYRPVSPSEFSTPTSATFSTGQSSPRWGSGIASPTSSHSRSQSLYAANRTPARRLSVPSGGVPFQFVHGTSLGPSQFSPANSSNQGAYSPVGSALASPTSSVFSRREPAASMSDEAWRRRTWHPDSSNLGGSNPSSRLSNVYTASQFQSPVGGAHPLANPPPQQGTAVRLPGIESFDPLPRPPATSPRQNPSPMMVDAEVAHPPALLPAAEASADHRRTRPVWDMSLHRGLTRLDITSSTTPPRDDASAWAQEANRAVEAQAERVRLNPPTVRFNDPVVVDSGAARPNSPTRAFHLHTMSAPTINRPRDAKRHGWYHGPVTAHADAPPQKMARVDRMVHPNINRFPGFPAKDAPPPTQHTGAENPEDRNNNMLRLQALVAVATSEGNATKAY